MYHVGLRVPDIHVAKAELSASMGLRWAPPQHFDMKPWVPGEGYKELELNLTESVEGPVHIELSQGTSRQYLGSPISAIGLHHFGVWVDDVGATVSSVGR